MAESRVLVDLPIDDVFELLVTPRSYPDWLVGAQRIRSIDLNWPAPGAAFHHVVGFGPVRTRDRTRVVAIDAPHRLELDVRARPFGRGRSTFTLRSQGPELTEIVLEEIPTSPLLAHVKPLVEPATKARNDASLAALADFVARRQGRPGSRFPFAFDGVVGLVARCSGAWGPRAVLELGGDGLDVRFGLWRVRTPAVNLAGAHTTGPYRTARVAGPLRVSLADKGLTFASTDAAGVCIHFVEPVALNGFGPALHPAVTVTVDEPERLVEALQLVSARPVSKS